MKWDKKDINSQIIKDLHSRYGVDPLTASILARRGITEGADILFWLEDDLRYLHNPFLFEDMEDAVDRVLDAKDEGEKVLIFGDRDVDGITSTTLLYQALKDLGVDVAWRVPSGDEPYGLTVEAVETHAQNYGSLIITVDNGITCNNEIARAQELGIDVIVIDHHNPQEIIPEAVAIINPKMEDSGYPFRDLAGCAVTWKFITALRFGTTELYKQQLCLLNVRPLNEVYTIEAVKLVNMKETARISESIMPGMVSISQTRLLPFLQGQQILVWDAAMQTKQLEKIFGKGVEFNFLDISVQIEKAIPQVKGMSLLRLKDLSKINRYQNKPISELDGFLNIFISYAQMQHKFYGQRETEELQLVALGTLADLMQLENENRIIVKKGLEAINAKPRAGLADLLAYQKLLGKKIGTGDISWYISPALNATGRMGQPELGVNLLITEDPTERAKLINEIIALNNERKQLGTESWAILEPLARESLVEFSEKLIVVASKDIHRGITGILANKLASYFKVPSIVMCYTDEDSIIGSVRSAHNYELDNLLLPCADLFIDHGGHTFAAGFSIKVSHYGELISRLKRLSADIEFSPELKEEKISIDAELPHTYLTPSLLDLVDKFEPYGIGNEPLTFMSKNMKIITADIMGKTERQHLKLTFDCSSYKWPAIFWKEAERLNKDFKIGETVDAVFAIQRNTFNGIVNPQMILQDIKRPES